MGIYRRSGDRGGRKEKGGEEKRGERKCKLRQGKVRRICRW